MEEKKGSQVLRFSHAPNYDIYPITVDVQSGTDWGPQRACAL